MPDTADIDEILRVFNARQGEGQDLEQDLLRQVLDPTGAQRHRVRIDPSIGDGVVYEFRSGTFINEKGVVEEIQEIVLNPNTLADGSSMNIYGIIKCPHCGSIIKEESIRMCCFCGSYVCVVEKCGYQSLGRKWFCSLNHRILGIFRKLY